LAGKAVALTETEGKTTSGLAGATQPSQISQADIKGKVFEYLWHLKKENRAANTLFTYKQYLNLLLKAGADLLNPDSVKKILAEKSEWNQNTKRIASIVYSGFAAYHGIQFKAPKYKAPRKLPFIPLESELDALICGSSKRMATLLQLLKETGLRIGEALNLRWQDLDFEHNILYINDTEKNGKPRVFKISEKLVSMLKRLNINSDRIFGKTTYKGMETHFTLTRKRLALRLGNPRLLRISFHTFRHWKATMEYNKTKDLLHVMQLLGHRNIETTLIYTQLVNFEKNEYHSATAKTIEEAKKLVEAGFEYVCTYNDILLFRKRK
jgi:integrase